MNKKELLCMRRLRATPQMVAEAQQDIPQKVTTYSWGHAYQEIRRKYQLFLRCRVEGSILKAALYYPDNLRAEGRLPSYEVFIDRNVRRFLTYDCINKKWLTAKVDRLDWPQSVPMYPCVWTSSADAKIAADYFGSNKLGYEAILDYQLECREEELARRHKKETDSWDADMALTPALPRDWNRWVDKVGIPHNFMFYRYEKQGAKTGYCTYCGKDVPLRGKPRHNQASRCPCCRHEITYKAIGRLGRYLDTEEVCVYLIQERPDGFVVREFWADRRYCNGDYKNPEVSCIEHWRVIYDREMVPRTYYWGSYKQCCMRWIAGVPSYSWMGANSIYNNHGNKEGRVYGKTLPHLAKSVLKPTGLADWIYAHEFVTNPDLYMTRCREIPPFEQIWKANLPKLTAECWDRCNLVKRVVKKPQSSNLTKALGIDKRGLARLRQYDGGIDFLCWLQVEKQSGRSIPDEVINWFCEHSIQKFDLNFIWDKMSPVQICNYLQRQAEISREEIAQILITWRDYLSMAERLGIDTSDEIVYRAKLLHQRHDELVLRCSRQDQAGQAAEVLESFPDVDKICRSIKEKYEYANGKYAVVVPNGALDIIMEGAMLHHCVGSSSRYWDRIERQETFILFLRKASAPHLPYYTLEVEPDGTIRQKRTKYDRQGSDIKEAEEFLLEWQRAVAERLTAGDQEKASDSRILREQEFEQMRHDNVIIYTGELAGQRLVDVLTADLMENAA